MTAARVEAHDTLARFVFEHAAVRGACVRLEETLRAVLACHPYPPALQRVLAELVAASVLLASTLKFTGSLIMQLQGDGPVRLLVVECTETLGLRAMAQWDCERTESLGPTASLADLAGGAAHGRLVITLDPKGAGAIYQGIVALETGSVAGLIEHYLDTSEQLASQLLLATESGVAGGLLVQRMPGATDDDVATWERACDALEAIEPAMLLAPIPPTERLAGLFAQEDVRVFRSRNVEFACSCSRARVENALRIAGADEIESILAERGDVEVTCEFCNRRYAFAPAEARALFVPESAVTRH